MRKGCPFGMKLGNLIGKQVHRCTHAHVGKEDVLTWIVIKCTIHVGTQRGCTIDHHNR